MPSSYTASARFTLQATGENGNTWGAILNSGAFELIDFAINGTVTISASGATILTTANGTTDQARAAILNYTGTTTGTLTIPSVSNVYRVRAATADCIVTNGSNSVTVKAGDIATVITNGTGVWLVRSYDFGSNRLKAVADPTSPQDAATKAYVDAQAFSAAAGNLPAQPGNAGKFITTDGSTASWGAVPISGVTGLQDALDAKEAIANRATAAQFQANTADKTLTTSAVWTAADFETITYAATTNLDLSTLINGTITLTGNVTFTFSNAKVGQSGCIQIVQDATGSRTATFPSEFKFAAGVKTLSTTANARDYLFFTVVSASLVICSLVKSPS